MRGAGRSSNTHVLCGLRVHFPLMMMSWVSLAFYGCILISAIADVVLSRRVLSGATGNGRDIGVIEKHQRQGLLVA